MAERNCARPRAHRLEFGAGPRMIFESTDTYIATDELSMAVTAAVELQRPLLIKGEPGTGKTLLAEEVAQSLGLPLIEWHIKSQTKALQGLYEYDAVSRLRDSQLGDDRVGDIRNYIKKGKLWEAFESDERVVLLIDEIDKADIEFPERPACRSSTGWSSSSTRLKRDHRRPRSGPSSSSPPTTRRNCRTPSCAAASSTTSTSPTARRWSRSSKSTSRRSSRHLVKEAMDIFFDVRKVPGLKKKPSTSELIDWLKLLMADDIPDEILTNRDPSSKAIPPLYGALVKNEQDVHLLERLAFMNRRDSRG